MRNVLILAVCSATWTACVAQEANVEKLLAQADPAIQQQIHQVLTTAESQTSDDFHTNVAVFQEIQKLTELSDEKSEIIKQIAIFAAAPTGEEHQSLFANMILHLFDPPPKVALQVLAPFLDTDNNNVRSFVRQWLRSHNAYGSHRSQFHRLTYKDYADYVWFQKKTANVVPVAFIEYLYESSPSQALLIFERASHYDNTAARLLEMHQLHDRQQRDLIRSAELPPQQPDKQRPGGLPSEELKQQRREILLIEHLVSNAIWLKEHDYELRFQQALPEAQELLAKLSEHDQWWARLYVAEIMRRHRELRQVDVLDKLSDDDSSLVNKSAKSTKSL